MVLLYSCSSWGTYSSTSCCDGELKGKRPGWPSLELHLETLVSIAFFLGMIYGIFLNKWYFASSLTTLQFSCPSFSSLSFPYPDCIRCHYSKSRLYFKSVEPITDKEMSPHADRHTDHWLRGPSSDETISVDRKDLSTLTLRSKYIISVFVQFKAAQEGSMCHVHFVDIRRILAVLFRVLCVVSVFLFTGYEYHDHVLCVTCSIFESFVNDSFDTEYFLKAYKFLIYALLHLRSVYLPRIADFLPFARSFKKHLFAMTSGVPCPLGACSKFTCAQPKAEVLVASRRFAWQVWGKLF